MADSGTITFTDFFNRAQELSTTPGVNGWTVKDTSAAGTPTYLCVTEDGGAMRLTLASTNEEEIVTMYMKDVLPIDLVKLRRISFIAKVPVADANSSVVFGLASAQADSEDAVQINAWFKIPNLTTGTVVCESDDGTHDNDDIDATSTTLSTAYKKFMIDLTNGITDVRFYIDDTRVASGTTFNMSSITSGQNVQPFIQLHKSTGTGVAQFQIAKIDYTEDYSY